MDLTKMKKTELYDELKRRDPAAAVGKTRVPRQVLEQALSVALAEGHTPAVVVAIPTKAQVSARKAALTKKRMAKKKALGVAYGVEGNEVAEFGKKLASCLRERRQAPIAEIEMSDDQRAQVLEGLDMVQGAGMLLLKSGLTVNQLVNFIFLDTGVDQEITRKVLVSLMALKATFTTPKITEAA